MSKTCFDCINLDGESCKLGPTVCLNYDHFQWSPMIQISQRDLEEKYVSRTTFDEMKARAEKAEARLDKFGDDVMEIIANALSGRCEKYLNYDLQGNKYCKWGIVEKDIRSLFNKKAEK